MTDFVHLHRHSEFSRLDGIGTPKQYAERAAELNQGILAQTDHGTLSGALHHIAACRKVGIVPIVGVEAYYRPNRKSRMTRQAWHLVLLAKNLRGWHNLLRLVSTAYADQSEGGGFYQNPCVDDELLDLYPEGIICTSACFQSWLAQLIRGGDHVAVRDYVRKMKNRYGDDFYLEVMPHDFDDQRMLNIAISMIADEESIPLVATNDSHFVIKEWADTQRIAKMMSVNLSFSKVEKMLENGEEPPYMSELIPNLFLCSRQDMNEWFITHHPDMTVKAWAGAIKNTLVLSQSIVPFMLDRTIKLPKVTETKEEANAILNDWIQDGLEYIYKTYPEEHWDKWPKSTYDERLDFEWNILSDKGAIPYMVMVGDIIRWCRENEIRVGVRGSAAGCLVSYLIGISSLDPIPWGLLFERFLNPGRKGMPDIDIDIQSSRRKEVKQYIIRKYGADHVADIITHERFQPKSVIQKLCRVYDIPYTESHAVTNTIDIRPDDEETKLDELLPLSETLRGFKSKYPHVWEHATRLEGMVANYGKHAAGVVITPEPIINYMALERGKKGDLVTSWADSADFLAVSDNGFMKVDMLGLMGLERHGYALKLIKERTGLDIDLDRLDPARDPREADPEVLKLFTDGMTIGLFQFGGSGITNLIRSIEPETVFDLTAANALYRPGPMNGGVTWDYARIKRGDKKPPKWSQNDLVWPTLSETYGLIAYQEQVMVLAQKLGNFTPSQADDLRKAMGKLYRIQGSAAREFMKGYKKIWDAGCAQNGIDDKIRDEVFEFFLGFGSYGFNKTLKYDTTVERFTTNQHDHDPNITVQEIWERFYGSRRLTSVGQKYRYRGLWIRGYDKDTGRITKKHVIDIHDHGIQKLYKITLENGLGITASIGHRHMTPDGWRAVGELQVGDELLFDTKVQDATRESGYRPIMTPGVGHGWTSKTKLRAIANDGRERPILHGHHSALMQVTKELPDYCEFCGISEVPLERAHLNHDRTDNSRENVKSLCNSCHKFHDGELRGGPWSRGSISGSSKILSIEYDGFHQTYDLEVEGDSEMDHNYVANGIVTHNSHSGWYGFRAYQDAWLKKYYPLEEYASLLTFPSGSSPQAKAAFISSVVREAKSRGYKFLPPDINKSDLQWTVDESGAIRVGLQAITDVGPTAASKIVLMRGSGYNSIDDVRSACGSKVNKKVIQALTESGAFDCFGARDEVSNAQIAIWERARLKMTITGVSEADRYANLIRPNIFTQSEIERLDKGTEVIVGGEITKIERKKTKNGDDFANVTIIFEENEWRVKFWSKQLMMFEDVISEGATVMVNGRKDEWNGFVSVIARDVCEMEDMSRDAKVIDSLNPNVFLPQMSQYVS